MQSKAENAIIPPLKTKGSMVFIFSIVLYGCGNADSPDTGLDSEPEAVVQDYDEDGFFNDVDCNDLDPEIHPDAIEICDDIDNDCDGNIDDEDENLLPDKIWYRDVDEDGFGDPSNSTQSCSAAIGFVANNEDCDDNNAQINPTAIEICDQDDNNCNGLTDSADETLDPSELVALIPDEDGDGYGAPSLTIYGCPNDPSPSNRLDCNDNNAQINPAMVDYCDGIDNNCDEQVDTIDEMYLLSGSEIVYYEPDQDIVFEQDGVVHNCYETLDMNIEFKASVDMLNHKEGTQLNGNILIYVNQNVSIDNLNIYANATHPEDVCIDCPPALMCTFGVDLTYSNGAITFGSAIEGGGIFGRACNVTLQNTTIQNTTALRGGGIYMEYGTLSIENSYITGGYATEKGGGVYVKQGEVIISDSQLSYSNAENGGGMYLEETPLQIFSSTIQNNVAIENGGALYFSDGTLDITDSDISDNEALQGGGIYANGAQILMNRNTMTSNRASNRASHLFLNSSSAEYTDSMMRSAPQSGALWLQGGASLDCENTSAVQYAGFFSNVAVGRGAITLYQDATFSSLDCDFGEEGVLFDNYDYDLENIDSTGATQRRNLGNNANISCDASGCTLQ